MSPCDWRSGESAEPSRLCREGGYESGPHLDILSDGLVRDELVLDAPDEDVNRVVCDELRGDGLDLPWPGGAVRSIKGRAGDER